MLDLALATHLFEALPDHARVILLGDKDQLAAVESGAVFAELSAHPQWSAARVQALARICQLPPDAIILHPGPMVRGVEIASDVADGPQSVIRDQVRNGVAVRMAVLADPGGAAIGVQRHHRQRQQQFLGKQGFGFKSVVPDPCAMAKI